MNYRVLLLLLAALVTGGCATPRGARSAGTQVVIIPDERLRGRIATVNTQGQFAVVDFNVGAMPPLQVRLTVYREGRVVGVVRLSGPVRDNLVAGDIESGEVAVGDEAVWDSEQEAGPGGL